MYILHILHIWSWFPRSRMPASIGFQLSLLSGCIFRAVYMEPVSRCHIDAPYLSCHTLYKSPPPHHACLAPPLRSPQWNLHQELRPLCTSNTTPHVTPCSVHTPRYMACLLACTSLALVSWAACAGSTMEGTWPHPCRVWPAWGDVIVAVWGVVCTMTFHFIRIIQYINSSFP